MVPDPELRRLAGSRVRAALRRLHRREPVRPGFRLDAVIGEVRADPAERRPGRGRGRGSLRAMPDAALLEVIDGLAAAGELVREGRQVRMASHEPMLADAAMRERVDRLLDGLREAGAGVPRVDAVAARLGIPPGVVEQLRTAGALVSIDDGIDYPPDVLASLLVRIDGLAARGPLSIARVRDALQTSRRHAAALLGHRRAQAAARRPRPARGRYAGDPSRARPDSAGGHSPPAAESAARKASAAAGRSRRRS
jgi:hypothetical protein